MSFEELNIIEPILKALKQEGYETPTPIQEQAIPALLEHRDLLGCAQTGTGKTAAFAVPIIQHLYNERKPLQGRRTIQALILTPTRELAAQIERSFSTYGAFSGLKNLVIFGGVSQKLQVQTLNAGVDILIATPGRLIDLIGQKCVDLRHISFFVLDEADHMLDMGFIRDVKKIIAELPTKRQTMLFSATMPTEIAKLTNTILKNPVKVEVTPVSSTVESIEQMLYYVNKRNKTKLLIHLLQSKEIVSALVFSRTKHGANKIQKDLLQAGITCDVIHANKAQSARQLALQRFKTNESRVLVATDIVARGIDIDELSHVINYDLPEVAESYVHRIGRTGRAGHGGTAISFCDDSEKKQLAGIEKLIAKYIPVISDHPYPLVAGDSTLSKEPTKRAPKKSSSSNYRKSPSKNTKPQSSKNTKSPGNKNTKSPSGKNTKARPPKYR